MIRGKKGGGKEVGWRKETSGQRRKLREKKFSKNMKEREEVDGCGEERNERQNREKTEKNKKRRDGGF